MTSALTDFPETHMESVFVILVFQSDNSCIPNVFLLVLPNSGKQCESRCSTGTKRDFPWFQSSADNVASTDICFMSNFSSHCCLTYLFQIIPSSRVRKLMNLSVGKGHHCNEVPGSCKATVCTPMFPFPQCLLSVFPPQPVTQSRSKPALCAL